MELIGTLVDLVLHLDRHLAMLVQNYGAWVYLILFAIIFCETGLVITPVLPGDSLLFIAGSLAALGGMNVHLLALLLVVAALLGNISNYAIGHFLGQRYFVERDPPLLNPSYIQKTHAFYEKWGGLAVIVARFVPFVRTYVPFVAGLSGMSRTAFARNSFIGAVLWVGLLVYLGYFFGNIPWIQQNLGPLALAVIVISLLPLGLAMLKAWLGRRTRS